MFREIIIIIIIIIINRKLVHIQWQCATMQEWTGQQYNTVQ